MLLLLVFAILFIAGLAVLYFHDDSFFGMTAIFVGGIGMLVIAVFIFAIIAYFPAETERYKEDILYIKSFDGIELSPEERNTITANINRYNKNIVTVKIMKDNLFVGLFYNPDLANFSRIEYNFNQSILNIKIKE